MLEVDQSYIGVMEKENGTYYLRFGVEGGLLTPTQ